MDAGIALLPLVLVVVLMIFARWSAAAAGLVGGVSALVVAVAYFDYRGSSNMGLLTSIMGLVTEATFLAATILWIVFPALCLHELQIRSGATETLRRGLALAPAVGALGTFITGSATASNILLTELQVAAATALGLPLVTMVAAQAFGAAVGNIICPHNIVAGSATVGLMGREGEVMKKPASASTTRARISFSGDGTAATASATPRMRTSKKAANPRTSSMTRIAMIMTTAMATTTILEAFLRMRAPFEGA